MIKPSIAYILWFTTLRKLLIHCCISGSNIVLDFRHSATVMIISDADNSSTVRSRTDGWADPTLKAPTHTIAHCPLASGPNNEEIYDHPCGLLALFPWETTRSSYTDLQECPNSWEPYWWETANPLCTALVHTELQGTRFKTRVMRGQQDPSKGFCRLF